MSQLNDVPATVPTAPSTREPLTEPDDVAAPAQPGGAAERADANSESGSVVAGQFPASLLEREGEVAADFLERLLDIADLDGDIDVDVEGDRAAVAIVDSDEGRVPRRLVGPDGKVLEALQELTRLAVQAATGERSRLMLDVAGHRAERRASLVATARRAIEQVRDIGERVPLDPMTAFERKVVHDEVVGAGLRSESEGVEPLRYVVILPSTPSTPSTPSNPSGMSTPADPGTGRAGGPVAAAGAPAQVNTAD